MICNRQINIYKREAKRHHSIASHLDGQDVERVEAKSIENKIVQMWNRKLLFSIHPVWSAWKVEGKRCNPVTLQNIYKMFSYEIRVFRYFRCVWFSPLKKKHITMSIWLWYNFYVKRCMQVSNHAKKGVWNGTDRLIWNPAEWNFGILLWWWWWCWSSAGHTQFKGQLLIWKPTDSKLFSKYIRKLAF